MVSSIQANSAPHRFGSLPAPQSLTEEQTAQVKSILSEYDADSLTAADAKAIFGAFCEAGIRPGPGLAEAIEAAGFDAEQLRTRGRPEGVPEPPGPRGLQGAGSAQGLNITALQSLQTILNQFDLTQLSDDQETELLTQLGQAGLLQSGNMLDLRA